MCTHCTKTPGLHSFSYLNKDEDNAAVFYSCPGKACYTEFDDGLVKLTAHIQTSLENVESWVWVLDGANFGLRNAMHIRTALALCKMFNADPRLKRIVIINPTWHIHSTMLFLYPIMSKEMRDKIKMQ